VSELECCHTHEVLDVAAAVVTPRLTEERNWARDEACRLEDEVHRLEGVNRKLEAELSEQSGTMVRLIVEQRELTKLLLDIGRHCDEGACSHPMCIGWITADNLRRTSGDPP